MRFRLITAGAILVLGASTMTACKSSSKPTPSTVTTVAGKSTTTAAGSATTKAGATTTTG
jgi:hypothetical protein